MNILAVVVAVVLTALAVAAQTPTTAKPMTIRLDSLPRDTRLCAPPDDNGTSACVDVGIAIDRIRLQGRDDCPE